ncbi:hypothetical protein KKB11_07255, partial [Candidatus Micrarchaeota archaeon]|nr:hypothetical protein [Candidatus Micrarchaeota archaeon]
NLSDVMAKMIHKKPGTLAYQKALRKSARKTYENMKRVSKKNKMSVNDFLTKINANTSKRYSNHKLDLINNLVTSELLLEKTRLQIAKGNLQIVRKELQISENVSQIFRKVLSLFDSPTPDLNAIKKARTDLIRQSSSIDILESRKDISPEALKSIALTRKMIVEINKKLSQLINRFNQ